MYLSNYRNVETLNTVKNSFTFTTYSLVVTGRHFYTKTYHNSTMTFSRINKFFGFVCWLIDTTAAATVAAKMIMTAREP